MGQEDETKTESRLVDEDPPYTIFTKVDLIVIGGMLSLIGWWSTLSSPIYFPALPTLRSHFEVSDTTMELSVTAYLLAQGIIPTFVSGVADCYGRRPMIVWSLSVYIAACIAISQTNVYWLLAFLRCIQAAGIAPVIAVGSGVSGDVCTPHNRAGFMGGVVAGQLLGNALGGLLGSALLSRWHTWRSIFIFLAIGGGATFCIALILLPETLKSIVGNGSVYPRWPYRSTLLYVPHIRKQLTIDTSTLPPRASFRPWDALFIFIKPRVLATLFPVGVSFAGWTMVLSSLSTQLGPKYNYSVIHIGLIYLPQGIVSLMSTILFGRIMNWYYRQSVRKFELKTTGERFNKIRPRLDVCVVPAVLNAFGLIIFGWCIQYNQHIISIIISTCLISSSTSSFMVAVQTMLVDMFPKQSSGAASCMNLMRCWLAALFVAVLDYMTASLGLGGCYTLIAGIYVIAVAILVLYVRHHSKQLKASTGQDSLKSKA
ncbi:MFS antiporter Qdrp1 [Diutina rugosa]